jgi:hypothetical protein
MSPSGPSDVEKPAPKDSSPVDRDAGLVRRRALQRVELDALEIPELLDALARSAQQGGVERVPLVQAELATDHLVERAHVADDVDALDVDPRAFVDDIGEIDDPRVGTLARHRLDLDEGIAELADLLGQGEDRILDLVGIVDLARLGLQQLAQLGRIEIRQLGCELDVAEVVALAFLDGERDHEASAIRCQLGDRRAHIEVGVAPSEVESP